MTSYIPEEGSPVITPMIEEATMSTWPRGARFAVGTGYGHGAFTHRDATSDHPAGCMQDPTAEPDFYTVIDVQDRYEVGRFMSRARAEKLVRFLSGIPVLNAALSETAE